MKFLGFVLLELVLLVIAVNGGDQVKRLPGYNGDLPFTLETGYVGVGESEEVQLFYYFVDSQKDPLQDPLVLWIPGGPSCTALGSLFFARGPLAFDIREYDGGLPSLVLNPFPWTQGMNIIYLDAPVGTEFSYSKTNQGYHTGDYKFSTHTYQFLVEGYMIGNPGTDNQIDFNSRIPLAHRLSFIPDKLFETAKTNCNDDFITPNPSEDCASDLASINKLISKINQVQVFEPSCTLPNLTDENMAQEYLIDKYRSGFYGSQPSSKHNSTQLWCREYNQVFSYIWANDNAVQEALHVHKGSKSSWQYCNDSLNSNYNPKGTSVVEYHRNLTNQNLQVLLYSGDVDMGVPYIGTLQWIMSLNMKLNESWRAWSVDDQLAGYTTKFTKNTNFNLTYATVKGAGHSAAEYRIKECSAMIHRWISYYPL